MSHALEWVKGRKFDGSLSSLEDYFLMLVRDEIMGNRDGVCHDQNLIDVVLMIRNFTDLCKLVMVIKPYIYHHVGCSGIPTSTSGPNGSREVVQHRCTCGYDSVSKSLNDVQQIHTMTTAQADAIARLVECVKLCNAQADASAVWSQVVLGFDDEAATGIVQHALAVADLFPANTAE